VSPSNAKASNNPLRVGALILWGFVVPQALLAILNWYGWGLIGAQTNAEERALAQTLWAFELGLLVLNVWAAWRYRSKTTKPHWFVPLSALLLHVGYMVCAVVYAESVIPASVQPWIINEGNVGRWNVTLIMPAAFLSVLALTRLLGVGYTLREKFMGALLGIFGVPTAAYLFFSLMQPVLHGQVVTVISILIGVITVSFFLGGIIYLFDNGIHKLLRGDHDNQFAVAAILGLIAPLAGLRLNEMVPFPVDFQSTGVYVLAIVNGLILLLRPGPRYLTQLLVLKAAALPFIGYFFFVFLPFLPLSLFAVFFLAGFLMLTPLVLGLYQLRVTRDLFQLVCAQRTKTTAWVALIVGLAVLPSYFGAQALLDKNAIAITMEHFYAHDMGSDPLSAGQVDRAADVLVALRDRKQDIQLPYLSGFYNWVVFGNLVLSDAKIERTYRLLRNSELPAMPASRFGFRSRHRFRGFQGAQPEANAQVEALRHTVTAPGQATLKIDLSNPSDQGNAMYVGDLNLPEGVFITGLRLKIEGDWVDGELFDRKTALWVFQKIVETRRDALLYYRGADQAELRVFPVPAGDVREVEVDLSYHSSAQVVINVDDQRVVLNSRDAVLGPALMNSNSQLLPLSALQPYALKRRPYVHAVLDFSQGSGVPVEAYLDALKAIRDRLGVSEVSLSAANLGYWSNFGGLRFDIDNESLLREQISSIAFAREGGLWIEQAVGKALLESADWQSETSALAVPIVVVVSPGRGPTLERNRDEIEQTRLDRWRHLFPDQTYWYSFFGGELQPQCLPVSKRQCLAANSAVNANSDVVLLKLGDRVEAVRLDQYALTNANSLDDAAVFDPASGAYMALDRAVGTQIRAVSDSNAAWSARAGLWVQWRHANQNPIEVEADRGRWLAAGRAQTMLLPTAALIAVESASQWEILRRKQAQSLSSHAGLDFEESTQQTPEPSHWVLLGFLFVYLLCHRYRVTNKTQKA